MISIFPFLSHGLQGRGRGGSGQLYFQRKLEKLKFVQEIISYYSNIQFNDNNKIFHRNCQIAFTLAETQLDIPSLLDIREMTDTAELDRRSILTYLSQFYHKFSKDPAKTETGALYQLSRRELQHTQSLPPTLNYSGPQAQPDITVREEANIAAIKELVFNNNNNNVSRPSPSTPRRGSDSGVEQEQSSESLSSSSRVSSESSSSLSRLSSISPPFKAVHSFDQSSSTVSRKYPANMIIKPKRSNLPGNNRIHSNQNYKYSQGKRNNNRSFQEAFIKFNSLSAQSAQSDRGERKEWRSQASQTEPEARRLVSQTSQTEERPHYHYSRNNNYVVMSGLYSYSTLV